MESRKLTSFFPCLPIKNYTQDLCILAIAKSNQQTANIGLDRAQSSSPLLLHKLVRKSENKRVRVSFFTPLHLVTTQYIAIRQCHRKLSSRSLAGSS